MTVELWGTCFLKLGTIFQGSWVPLPRTLDSVYLGRQGKLILAPDARPWVLQRPLVAAYAWALAFCGSVDGGYLQA